MYTRRKKIPAPLLRRTTPQNESHSLYTSRYIQNVANPHARKSRSVAGISPSAMHRRNNHYPKVPPVSNSDRIERIPYVMETDFDYTDFDVLGTPMPTHHEKRSSCKPEEHISRASIECGVQVATNELEVDTKFSPGMNGDCVRKDCMKKRNGSRSSIVENCNEMTDVKKTVSSLRKSFDMFREAVVTNRDIELDRQESVEFQLHDRFKEMNEMCRDILRRQDENRSILNDMKSEIMRLNVRYEERERMQTARLQSVTNEISEIRHSRRSSDHRRLQNKSHAKDSSSVILNVNIQAGLSEKKAPIEESALSADEMQTIFESKNRDAKLRLRTETATELPDEGEKHPDGHSHLDLTSEQSDTSTHTRRSWKNLFNRVSHTVLSNN